MLARAAACDAETPDAINAVIRRTRDSSSVLYRRNPPDERSGRSNPYRCSHARSSSTDTPVLRESSPIRTGAVVCTPRTLDHLSANAYTDP
jgi:hypothetical protein